MAEFLDGRPLAHIAKGLNEDGIPPSEVYRGRSTGEFWHVSSIRNKLRSKSWLWYVHHKGETVRDEAGAPVVYAEPLVSLDEWNRVQTMLGSSLAADDAAFEAAYPLALSGGVGVTEESLFPMMSASENLNPVGLLIENRGDRGDINAMPVMQLCRSAMESSARTIWILGHPDREVRRDRALNVLVEQLEQQKRFIKISEDTRRMHRVRCRRTSPR